MVDADIALDSNMQSLLTVKLIVLNTPRGITINMNNTIGGGYYL